MSAFTADSGRELDRGLSELGLTIGLEARDALLRFLALLQKWNRVYNLTAIRERARLVSHHLLDSLAALPHLPGPRLVDVGSGAGLPGLPVAIVRRDWEVTLVESNHKKGAFLRQAVIELELSNVQVAVARAEDLRPSRLVNGAVSRAFSDLAGFVQAARRLVLPGGILAAMKGVYPHEELAQLPGDVTLDAVVPLAVPGLNAARHIVLLRLSDSPL